MNLAKQDYNAPVNLIAGDGQHSHEVPTVELLSVLIRDRSHNGTIVTLMDGQFVAVDLDNKTVNVHERCALVRLAVGLYDAWLNHVPDNSSIGCDLDCPDGLVLVCCDADDDMDSLGEILWDSHIVISATFDRVDEHGNIFLDLDILGVDQDLQPTDDLETDLPGSETDQMRKS